jgi:leucyl aminopeptidase
LGYFKRERHLGCRLIAGRYIIAASFTPEDISLSLPDCFTVASDHAIPLFIVSPETLPSVRDTLGSAARRWIEQQDFTADAGTVCQLPDSEGGVDAVLVGRGDAEVDTWTLCKAAEMLPSADYRLDGDWHPGQRHEMAVGWALARYSFDRYRDETASKPGSRLVVGEDATLLASEVEALYLVRDLINTAPNDMMPADLAAAAATLAGRFDAQFREIVGEALLEQNYPTIHMVGRASVHAPRLIELRWGRADDPLLVLVGKGVCFDTGGLDLKPSKAMRLMQKDMGGAAHVLGLAAMVMANRLPVRLRVLIPAVDNAVSGDAFRPGDVVRTRKGLTVEVDNTDAEGRLVLCDALSDACDDKPDLLIDFATLTGSARSAVGTEIAAFFSNSDQLSQMLLTTSAQKGDPVWRLPLHQPYNRLLKSRFADLVNCASSPYAGAIVAALFLQRFVDETIDWLHFDMMAWNTSSSPGHPEGGEAMGVRAMFALLLERYG